MAVSQPHHSISAAFYLIVLLDFARRSPVAGEPVNDDHPSLAEPTGIVMAEMVDWKSLALPGFYTVAFTFTDGSPGRARWLSTAEAVLVRSIPKG